MSTSPFVINGGARKAKKKAPTALAMAGPHVEPEVGAASQSVLAHTKNKHLFLIMVDVNNDVTTGLFFLSDYGPFSVGSCLYIKN